MVLYTRCGTPPADGGASKRTKTARPPVLMPGAPTPKAESRELGDFYADRRPHATRLMEHLLASGKLAAAERAARPSLRRNPKGDARSGGVAACLGAAP